MKQKIKYADMKYFEKCFLVCTIAILGITIVHAQPEYNEIRPSVNAQQFISAASAANSLQTGQLSVNIPLFELQGIGIKVPISISFNGGNITHESMASNIGLGWSLLAGGVITRTVRGEVDAQSSTPDNRPWQYQENYIQNKWYEQSNNISSGSNLFDIAMDAVGTDPEPDSWNYSFLGHSGDIYCKYNNDGSISRTLYPDKSFLIEKTTAGYKVTASDGVEYLFEISEQKGYSATSYTTSWFLTEIKTLQGGHVIFNYTDDCGYDPATQTFSSTYAAIASKRLTRIDYDYGYVLFGAEDRSDMSWPDTNKKSKRITNIELYDDKGSLIKGYQLGNNSYMVIDNQSGSITWANKKLKLGGIREYDHNGEYLPPYEFEYDYYLTPLPVDNPFPNLPKNTWAHNPAPLASMDRTFNGDLCPWMTCQYYEGICIPYALGYKTTVDPIDGFTIHDYLCLTKIKFPTGGNESYYYEAQDYRYLSTSTDFVQPDNYLLGKRLWKKVTTDGSGNTQTVMYKYVLHDQSYQPTSISSGVLVNPSIHTSTIYKPAYDYDRPRLAASPHYTQAPQNSISGSPVYYTEVEEDFISGGGVQNGKKIYYYDKMYALPAINSVYMNYSNGGSIRSNLLIGLPNTLYGKQRYPPNDPDLSGMSNQNFTYLAYPVGRFCISHLIEGKLLKEITLDANGTIVRKIKNEYTPGILGPTLYGLIVLKFDDNNYSTNPHPVFPVNRYLISRTMTQFGVSQLLKKTITSYLQNDSIVEDQSFVYTGSNLLKSAFTTTSKGKNIETTQEYVLDNPTGLSTSTTVLQDMVTKNMVGIPMKTVKKVDNILTEGTIIDFGSDLNPSNVKELTGSVYDDKITFDAYDSKGNVLQYHRKSNYNVSYIWGYNQAFPVAKIENAAYTTVSSNSTLMSYINQLQNYSDLTDATVRSNLKTLNNNIRNNKPANSMITTYTYKPLVGMTSATDPNGATIYYEYDSFGRLATIRDDDGHILKTYEYHYKQ